MAHWSFALSSWWMLSSTWMSMKGSSDQEVVASTQHRNQRFPLTSPLHSARRRFVLNMSRRANPKHLVLFQTKPSWTLKTSNLVALPLKGLTDMYGAWLYTPLAPRHRWAHWFGSFQVESRTQLITDLRLWNWSSPQPRPPGHYWSGSNRLHTCPAWRACQVQPRQRPRLIWPLH